MRLFSVLKSLARVFANERGATLVETAIGIPIFYLAILFPTIDLFRLSFAMQSAQFTLEQAVRDASVWTVETPVTANVTARDGISDPHAQFFQERLQTVADAIGGNFHLKLDEVTVCPVQIPTCPAGQINMGEARDLLRVKIKYAFNFLFIPGFTLDLSANLLTRNEVTFQAPGTSGGVDFSGGAYVADWELPLFVEPDV